MNQLIASSTSRHLRPAELLALLGLLLAAAFFRFYRITEVGMDGHDTFQYFDYSKRFLDGHPYLFFYRPVAYACNAAAMWLVGSVDYAMLLSGATADLLTVLLLYILCRQIGGSVLLSTLTASLYAFSPFVLTTAVSGLLHVYGALFITLAVVLFILFAASLDKAKFRAAGYMFLTGLSVGLAAHTHEELSLVSIAFGSLSVWLFSWQKNQTIVRSLMAPFIWGVNLLYSIGFLLPLAIGIRIEGLSTLIENARRVPNTRADVPSLWQIFNDGFTALQKFLFDNFNAFVVVLIALGAGTILWSLSKRHDVRYGIRVRYLAVALVVPFTYWLCYSFFIRELLSRLFLPFLPLCTVVAVFGLYLALCESGARRSHTIVGIVVMLILAFQMPWEFLVREPTYHRQIYNVVKDFVNDDNRLLLPIGYDGRGPMWGNGIGYGLRSDMYLGSRAVSLVNLPLGKTFARMVTDEKVSYVLIDLRNFPRNVIRSDYDLDKYFEDYYGLNTTEIANDQLSIMIPDDIRAKRLPLKQLISDHILLEDMIMRLERYGLRNEIKKMHGQKVAEIPDMVEIYKIER